VNPLYHLISGTKYNGQKYDITDTSGILVEKYDITDTCCKMLDACVICVLEGHWRVQSIIGHDV
jgi:hypothetical protein